MLLIPEVLPHIGYNVGYVALQLNNISIEAQKSPLLSFDTISLFTHNEPWF